MIMHHLTDCFFPFLWPSQAFFFQFILSGFIQKLFSVSLPLSQDTKFHRNMIGPIISANDQARDILMNNFLTIFLPEILHQADFNSWILPFRINKIKPKITSGFYSQPSYSEQLFGTCSLRNSTTGNGLRNAITEQSKHSARPWAVGLKVDWKPLCAAIPCPRSSSSLKLVG